MPSAWTPGQMATSHPFMEHAGMADSAIAATLCVTYDEQDFLQIENLAFVWRGFYYPL